MGTGRDGENKKQNNAPEAGARSAQSLAPEARAAIDWRNHPLVTWLASLVEISSGTGNPRGVAQVQQEVADRLSPWGATLRWQAGSADQAAAEGRRFLIADFPAASAEAPIVTLVTHADTVFEESSGFRGFRLDTASEKGFGPGAIDDKGGIVVACEALRRWNETVAFSSRRIALRLLVAPSEETGSPGFHAFLARMGQESAVALGIEPALDDGSIVRSRRGNRWYHIRVEGRAAHPGRHLAQGVNAAHELAFKLVALHRLSGSRPGLGISTGTVRAGERSGERLAETARYNVVCPEAEACVDVRFDTVAEREAAHAAIESIVEKTHLAPAQDGLLPRASYRIEDDCPPMDPAEPGPLDPVGFYISQIEKLEGRRIQASGSGGAADVNYMSRPGLLMIDGLGPCGGAMHTDGEFIALRSLETRSEALLRLLHHFNSHL
jgi:glutamate carboxypeptidase